MILINKWISNPQYSQLSLWQLIDEQCTMGDELLQQKATHLPEGLLHLHPHQPHFGKRHICWYLHSWTVNSRMIEFSEIMLKTVLKAATIVHCTPLCGVWGLFSPNINNLSILLPMCLNAMNACSVSHLSQHNQARKNVWRQEFMNKEGIKCTPNWEVYVMPS